MEELPVKAEINAVTNYVNGLKNAISSQKSGVVAFFLTYCATSNRLCENL